MKRKVVITKLIMLGAFLSFSSCVAEHISESREMYVDLWDVQEHSSYFLNDSLIGQGDKVFVLSFEKSGDGIATNAAMENDFFKWGGTEVGVTIQPKGHPFKIIEDGFYFFKSSTANSITIEKLTFDNTPNGKYVRYLTWIMTRK